MIQINQYGQPTLLIHFTQSTADGGEQIACMPNMREFHETQYHPPYRRTNEPRAVTCPACKRADVFKGHPDAQSR